MERASNVSSRSITEFLGYYETDYGNPSIIEIPVDLVVDRELTGLRLPLSIAEEEPSPVKSHEDTLQELGFGPEDEEAMGGTVVSILGIL